MSKDNKEKVKIDLMIGGVYKDLLFFKKLDISKTHPIESKGSIIAHFVFVEVSKNSGFVSIVLEDEINAHSTNRYNALLFILSKYKKATIMTEHVEISEWLNDLFFTKFEKIEKEKETNTPIYFFNQNLWSI